MHHWDYDVRALDKIVYKNWYRQIDDIEKIEKDDSLIDFVRLTNGDDVLLHENVQRLI